MNITEQQFFDDLEKKLWTASNKLLPSLDAAVYKHIVLGLLFIKYVSDAFEERQQELKAQFQDPAHDYYMNPADYPGTYDTDVAAELEVRDYYTEKNVFWVPLEARWQTLVNCAQLPPGAALPWPQAGKAEPEKMRTVGWLIDNAMEAIERENPKLKNVLNKTFVNSQIESPKLAELIALFSDTNFHATEHRGQPLNLKAKDILGHIYEYFLGQFALAEGKKGGQYYTPKAIVGLIVNMLQPFKGRVYDPCMGSGGFFVQSEDFIEQHAGLSAKNQGNKASGQISVYGQESNPTTWKLAAMNMAKDEAADLFNCNAALVISDGFTARVGSLTADAERMLPWRTIANENDRPRLQMELETLVRGFFKPELFLDYVRHFVLFEQDGDSIVKKIAGYHQFHAVREAVRATVIASQDADKGLLEVREERATYGKEVQPGSRKAGVVWHTQGSGKSITMACYAGKLLQQPEMKNPTLVVVTDRNDLDGQLFATFSAASDLLRTTPVQATGRDELRDMLASREAGGIIFTTVQKFVLLDDEAEHPLLSNRSNIVVMSDEAHRSQYGMKGRLDTKTGKYVYGYAKHLRDALKNATFIGFTGTPIALEDKDTRAVFGDYVSIYDIQDAVDDGATVPIFYESRLAKLDVKQAEIDALNAQVDEVFEDEEDVAVREKSKSEWAALEKLVGAAPRLQQVANDLVQHFEARISVIDGKAMIVCMSREICVQLYNAICVGDEKTKTPPLRPEWHSTDPEQGAIKVVMTGSAADKALLQPHIYTNQVKKRLEKRFKDPKDSLKLVIVRDMWLTGFDAPSCHTMYVDKPMKGHNLMQAIARVNRVFKNKPGGLVVDYIGIANELKAALKDYTDSKGKGDPAHNAAEALAVLLEKMDIVRGLMHGFDYSAFKTHAVPLLVPAAEHILGQKDGKTRFLDTMTAVSKAFSLCGTLDEASALRQEIAFFAAIKAAINKFTTVDKKRSDAEKSSALKQILDNAIVADGVADIFALAGLDKPNIGLLSDEFLEDVRQMKTKNLAVELLEKLLRDEIKARARNNVVQEKKYGDRLLETLRKYHNRAIETAQVIEELIEMAKEFQAVLEREASLGLSPHEIAFYDALANNESAVRELGDEILKKIAVEITEKLRASTTVDWQVRESVRARLRILVRRTLQKWKYPPDRQVEAVELVLKQAESLSNDWSK